MENKPFNYTYSAEEQTEIQRIRQKYASQEADKMEQLRRLDRSVSEKATVFSLVLGILGALLLGGGMSCVMVVEGIWFIPGLLLGVLGLAVVSLAYPVYLRVLKKERERIAPEILRLSEELLK
ncbi:MAG: hypothetical protein IJ043_04420 [Clostridia bacterium]|nr:hypothetical protein [Clostridia bacterium]